jgi:hypothetical protein
MGMFKAVAIGSGFTPLRTAFAIIWKASGIPTQLPWQDSKRLFGLYRMALATFAGVS